jgi:hypothetical protein
MARQELSLRFRVGTRKVDVKAYDTVGVEDAYSVLFRAAIHRIATGESLAEPVPRNVKDWIIKTNLFV